MGWWARVVWVVGVGGLLACNPGGLVPVDDTGADDTGDTGGLGDLVGILVTPDRAAIPLGGELQLKATGLREDRTSTDVTAVATWGSSRPSVAQVSDDLDDEGVLRGLAVGEAEVFAEIDGMRSVPVKVTVTDAALLGLSVQPAQLTVEKGQIAHVKAEAAFSDGTRADASAQVVWVTGSGQVATLEAGGKLTAVEVGTTNVHAEWQGVQSKQIPVTVVQGANANLRVVSVEGETGPDEVTLTVRIVNDGTAGASDFWVDVFVDPEGTPAPGAFGDYYEPVFYADAGEELELGFNFQAEAGPHTIWVVLDSDDAVSESDEADNAMSASVTVGNTSLGPNLTITYFGHYATATQIYYVVDVYNSGSADVGEFWLDLWVHAEDDPTASGIGDDFKRVDGLAAGETEYADFVIDVEDLDAAYEGCAYCWSWVMVDTNGEIGESNEDDNVEGPIEVEVPAAR